MKWTSGWNIHGTRNILTCICSSNQVFSLKPFFNGTVYMEPSDRTNENNGNSNNFVRIDLAQAKYIKLNNFLKFVKQYSHWTEFDFI